MKAPHEKIHDYTQPVSHCTSRHHAHPESEVSVWCSITAAWIAYHEQHLGDELLPDEDEKKLLAALLSISTGVEDVEVLGVPQMSGESCWLVTTHSGMTDHPSAV